MDTKITITPRTPAAKVANEIIKTMRENHEAVKKAAQNAPKPKPVHS